MERVALHLYSIVSHHPGILYPFLYTRQMTAGATLNEFYMMTLGKCGTASNTWDGVVAFFFSLSSSLLFLLNNENNCMEFELQMGSYISIEMDLRYISQTNVLFVCISVQVNVDQGYF